MPAMNSSTIGPLGDSYRDDQVQGIGLARNQGSPPFQKVRALIDIYPNLS